MMPLLPLFNAVDEREILLVLLVWETKLWWDSHLTYDKNEMERRHKYISIIMEITTFIGQDSGVNVWGDEAHLNGQLEFREVCFVI